jgi:hypothetical protein
LSEQDEPERHPLWFLVVGVMRRGREHAFRREENASAFAGVDYLAANAANALRRRLTQTTDEPAAHQQSGTDHQQGGGHVQALV